MHFAVLCFRQANVQEAENWVQLAAASAAAGGSIGQSRSYQPRPPRATVVQEEGQEWEEEWRVWWGWWVVQRMIFGGTGSSMIKIENRNGISRYGLTKSMMYDILQVFFLILLMLDIRLCALKIMLVYIKCCVLCFLFPLFEKLPNVQVVVASARWGFQWDLVAV